MAFPEVPRVIYEINPLEGVICQLRFPPILKIGAESPVGFQERVRVSYPIYKAKSTLNLLPGVSAELTSLITQDFPFGGGQIAHEFTSIDEIWSFTLARDFVSLRCNKYERWEQFREHLGVLLAAFQELYVPAFYARIGLRYTNVIRRSRLGLGSAAWADLLKPWIAGAFASSEMRDDIEGSAHQLIIRLPDGQGRVHINHLLAPDNPSQESCYMIDADFYDDQRKTEPSHALDRLDFFHKQSDLFFRWCIDDRLHAALRPRPLPKD